MKQENETIKLKWLMLNMITFDYNDELSKKTRFNEILQFID